MPRLMLSGEFGAPIVDPPSYNDISFRSRGNSIPLIGDGYISGNKVPAHRGFMCTPAGTKPKIIFHFMYNPNEVRNAYDINQQMLAPETLLGQDPAAYEEVNNLVGGASISFALLIDRTVEVANRQGSSSGTSAARIGVLHDLAVFEQLVGNLGAGQIVSRPIEVHFTGRGTFSPLNFKGYITACEILFGGPEGMFNQSMIPTRCSISITMRRVFVADPSASSSQSGGVTTTNNGDGTQTQTAQVPTDGGVVHRKPDGTLEVLTAEEWREWQEQHK